MYLFFFWRSLVIFGLFWSFLVDISNSMGPVFITRVEFFCSYQPLALHWVYKKGTRPDTRPIPVADRWAGVEMCVFILSNSITMTDGPTDGAKNQWSDKASYRVARPQLKIAIQRKNFYFFSFISCVKRFIFMSFFALFGFLSAPYRTHWSFLGLYHFHDL